MVADLLAMSLATHTLKLTVSLLATTYMEQDWEQSRMETIPTAKATTLVL